MVKRSASALAASSLLASSAMADWAAPAPAALTQVCEVITVTHTGAPVWIPADPTWGDWESAAATTVVVDPTWSDWESAAAATTVVVDPTWVDWESAAATTVVVDPTWSDWEVTKTKTKTVVDPTWVDWTTTTKKVKPTTKPVDPTWVDWTTTTTTADPTWVDWTTTTTTTTTADPTWLDWTTSVVTTTPAPVVQPTTTQAPPPAAPTCPADNGKSVLAGGSCGCSFSVNCGVRASPDPAVAKFWEKSPGTLYSTLAECLALCDSNSQCQAALWVDDSTNADYHKCWQISGLGQPTGEGVAQISYKGSCSGKCSDSYNGQ